MTDPKPIFTTDAELDTVIQPGNPVVLGHGGFQLEFGLAKYGLDDEKVVDGDNETLSLKITYAFPNGGGFFELSENFGEDDTEELYRLVRVAVLNQLRREDQEYAEEKRHALALAELPKSGRLKDADFPAPFTEPLVLESGPAKKVLDWRQMGHARATNERDHPWHAATKYADHPDWVYVSGVKVHLAICPKIVGKTVYPASTTYYSTNSGDGRRATWLDVTTLVRRGILAPELCIKCQPLGQYSKFVANQVTYLNNPTPDTMPTKYVGHGELTTGNQQWLWNRLSAMDRTSWEALADFIEWAAAEVDDTPPAEAPAT